MSHRINNAHDYCCSLQRGWRLQFADMLLVVGLSRDSPTILVSGSVNNDKLSTPLQSNRCPLEVQARGRFNHGNAVEPMEVDAPLEDNVNTEEDPYLVENPTLDLESYANSYTGLARLYRLMYIAYHCPPLRVEALKMAIKNVMQTDIKQLQKSPSLFAKFR
ncbi:hypothetical protein J6590_050700 [Homalodisca vitripennis]|nr:hypothetical protein J6590_050700 [Homalodisca vitripennis]